MKLRDSKKKNEYVKIIIITTNVMLMKLNLCQWRFKIIIWYSLSDIFWYFLILKKAIFFKYYTTISDKIKIARCIVFQPYETWHFWMMNRTYNT